MIPFESACAQLFRSLYPNSIVKFTFRCLIKELQMFLHHEKFMNFAPEGSPIPDAMVCGEIFVVRGFPNCKLP